MFHFENTAVWTSEFSQCVTHTKIGMLSRWKKSLSSWFSVVSEIPTLPIWSGVSRFDVLPPTLPIFTKFSRFIIKFWKLGKNCWSLEFLAICHCKTLILHLLSSRRALWYVITQVGMMSKFKKWHLREPKFVKFPGGACPRTPLKVRTSGANNYSLFSITWGWNLCKSLLDDLSL